MLRVRILGLLEVRASQEPIAISGRHHPRMLAMLLEQANRVLPIDRIVEGLWDHDPPATATRQVQNIAAALRRQLGPVGERLQKVGTGYRFRIEEEELDLLRCRRSERTAQEHQAAGRLEEAERALGEALAEWTGPSLAGLSGSTVEASARMLDEYRLKLLEERIELGLTLGKHVKLVDELQRLHFEHPARQRFTEQLMLALYRSGRGPEALRVYADVAERLAEELGADPGKPLRELHTAVLREEPSLAPTARPPAPASEKPAEFTPETLPASTTVFTGRDESLAALDESADSDDSPLVVLTGAGGTGKTMLALHWGHRSSERFPGGRLYIDLRGFAPSATALEPAEAARVLLGAVGVDPRRIPADPEAQIALYRSVIGERQRLLILDNARDADQIRPLLPGSDQVRTLVISRRRLVGLAASHGARIIEVGSFSPKEARMFLERHLGRQRLAAEPGAAERLLSVCAGLPLALAIAAAQASARADSSLSAIADELEIFRLDALAGGEASVDLRAVFSWSYRSLSPDSARMFALLALIPGPDFGLESAIRLHGGPRTEAGQAFRELLDAHLVEHDRTERYRLHDLVRLYASEIAEAQVSEHDRAEALRRLLDWYCERAGAVRSILYPESVGLRTRPAPDGGLPTSATEAAQWLKSEWTNLIAAVERTAHHGPSSYAWRLADMLRGYVWLGMRGDDGLRLGRAALTAAKRAGDPAGMAAAELVMTVGLIRCNRLEEAVEHGLEAANTARRLGWTAGAAAAEGNLAAAAFYRGRCPEGLKHAHAALEANREVGERRAECTSLHWLGILHSLVGELDTGIGYFEAALRLAEETGTDSIKAVMLMHLAEVKLFRGRPDAAAAHLEEAAELERAGAGFDRSGDMTGATARVRLASGQAREALRLAQQVVETRTDAADHRIRMHALVTVAGAYEAIGEPAAAVSSYNRLLAETAHEPTLFHRVEALAGLPGPLLRTGESDRARAAARRAVRVARKAGYRFLEGRALNQLAAVALRTGDPGGAGEAAREALRMHRQTGHRPGEAASQAILAEVAAAGEATGGSAVRLSGSGCRPRVGTAVPSIRPEER